MSVLVIADHNNQTLNPQTLSVITAALEIDANVEVAVIGHQCHGVTEKLSGVSAVSRIFEADHSCYAHQLAEAVTPLILELASSYSHILAAATTTGKNLLPRVAALLDVAQISEVTEIVSADTFVRPVYAGNALMTVQSSDSIKLMTVRTSSFEEASAGGGGEVEVVPVATEFRSELSRFVGESITASERPELGSAAIVISGGRGLQSADNFRMIERIADKLGAAIGASRAAVDAGYISNDHQVGQTGKAVAPELYIAVGISGAIQHLAGMKDSKIIVAINRDGSAPIFQVADYGLVGDLFEILPEIEALL